MKVSEMFPSKFLSASDIPMGKQVQVVIQSIEFETMNDGKQKPILYFQDKQKGMVLNVTNANKIATMHGDETQNWIGQHISINSEPVQGPNGPTTGLRVVPYAQPRGVSGSVGFDQPATQAASGSAAPMPADMDDDIPF